jgi:hypothetical protein
MATLSPSRAAPELAARERHLRACMRVLEGRGWQQRLTPLAQLLVQMRLVRGQNEHGTPARKVDGELLRQTPIEQCLAHVALAGVDGDDVEDEA